MTQVVVALPTLPHLRCPEQRWGGQLGWRGGGVRSSRQCQLLSCCSRCTHGAQKLSNFIRIARVLRWPCSKEGANSHCFLGAVFEEEVHGVSAFCSTLRQILTQKVDMMVDRKRPSAGIQKRKFTRSKVGFCVVSL